MIVSRASRAVVMLPPVVVKAFWTVGQNRLY